MPFLYGGYSSVGYKRDLNEDFLLAKSLDRNSDIVLAMIADGAGSMPSQLQPAQIACRYVESFITRVYESDDGANKLINNAAFFLKESIMYVNSVLGAFRTANEEIYSGFYCAMTCALFFKTEDGSMKMAFAHSGNTRLYLLRRSNDGNAILRQLTKDHTEAQELVDSGRLSPEEYYFHELRNKLTCPIGMFEKPKVDVFEGKIRNDCLFLLSTDGIHYAIRPEAMTRLILENENFDVACKTLCEAAENLQYNDDYCALLLTSV